YSNIEVTLLSDLIKEEAEKLEAAKKKENSLEVNEEGNSEKEEIKQVEQSTEIKDVELENSEKKMEEEKQLNENEEENTAEDNLLVENNNLSEQNQKEEKSSEPIQNIVSDNPKAKSIFDKF